MPPALIPTSAVASPFAAALSGVFPSFVGSVVFAGSRLLLLALAAGEEPQHHQYRHVMTHQFSFREATSLGSANDPRNVRSADSRRNRLTVGRSASPISHAKTPSGIDAHSFA
jgi:hypothetical protein